jgi:hypothetical protein
VRRPRTLLLLVLIYIGFDLSLPAMPGAFVFDPSQSIESVGRTQSRLAGKAVIHPTPARCSLAFAQRLDALPPRVVPRRTVVQVAPIVVSRRPPARCDLAPSEDPH